MSQQLILDLPVRPALGRESFFVSASNALALEQIDTWQGWAGRKLVLIGPEGSGKSHLTAVWAEQAGAQVLDADDTGALERVTTDDACMSVAVEDVDRVAGDGSDEETLFHLHNAVLARGGSLLMSGRDVPSNWGVVLPDLASRILAADVARLGPPDDQLLAALLVKLFDDRQLHVEPQVISYLAKRIDRSYAHAEEIVARLDRAALSSRRRITRPFARDVLQDDEL